MAMFTVYCSMPTIEEGTEWSDGFFASIAYRKADGRMVVRDVEGFDIPMDEWEEVLKDGETHEVDSDLEGYVKIERWEAEVGTLPR